MPCSQLIYVEAVISQKKEDLKTACEHMLQYIEGVPQAIVPDNLRSAVSKSSKYEAVINEDFAGFAGMVLRPLNPISYELKKQSIVTVMKNGHIWLLKQY